MASNTYFANLRSLTSLTLFVFMLGGCASGRVDAVEARLVTLEPTLRKSLPHAPKAYKQDGGLVVEGQLDADEATYGGHVDVVVIGPDGAQIYDAAVNYKQPPHRPAGGRRGPRSTRSPAANHTTYSVRFPGMPPEGSIVKVKHNPVARATETNN